MLRLQVATVAEILRLAAANPGKEVCGLVWANQEGRQRVWAIPNTHPEPERYYRTAPKDVGRAYAAMDYDYGTPLAWYHSHPSGKRTPSSEDMAGAFNMGMHYLIAYPELEMDPTQLRAGYVRQWLLSAWECLTIGVLVEDEWESAS